MTMTCQDIGASILLPNRGTELGSSSINAWILKKLALLALFETLKFTQNMSFISCSSEKSHSYANPFFYASLFWAKNIADYLCKANDQENENHL